MGFRPSGLVAMGTVALLMSVATQSNAQLGGGFGGVAVDGNKTLRTFRVDDPRGVLTRKKFAAAKAALDPDVARHSKLRKVSLTRLEKELAKLLAAGRGPTDEMKYLAGMTRIQYVFYYPETKDIVIAGPAEGWATVAPGRVVGIETKRATLELQDLVVALRTFPPGKKGGHLVGCSIDPSREGLAKMQKFLRGIGSSARPGDAKRIVDGLRTSLGLHDVSVTGIPADTHAAQVLVEADYRMKLIGLGMERPKVRIKSYVDLANTSTIRRNAMQRWYFIPNYECVRVGDGGRAMELVGDAVQLVGENEVVLKDGTRKAAALKNRASTAFTTGFTKLYGKLADTTPVYAQLRNLIDLFVAAAFIQNEDYYGKAGWKMATLGDEDAFAVRTYQAPVHVETAVRAAWKGRTLVTPIGGGVMIKPRHALRSSNLLEDKDGAVAKTRKSIDLSKLPAGTWWWD